MVELKEVGQPSADSVRRYLAEVAPTSFNSAAPELAQVQQTDASMSGSQSAAARLAAAAQAPTTREPAGSCRLARVRLTRGSGEGEGE